MAIMVKSRGRKRENPDEVGLVVKLSTPIMNKLGKRAKKAQRSKSKEAAHIVTEVIEKDMLIAGKRRVKRKGDGPEAPLIKADSKYERGWEDK